MTSLLPSVPPLHEQYATTAASYIRCARIIVKNAEPFRGVEGDFMEFPPIYLLLCFGIEITLKAFLLHMGISEKKLIERNTRHDLVSLFELAENKGLNKQNCTDIDLIVRRLNGSHKDHAYRYDIGGGITVIANSKKECLEYIKNVDILNHNVLKDLRIIDQQKYNDIVSQLSHA